MVLVKTGGGTIQLFVVWKCQIHFCLRLKSIGYLNVLEDVDVAELEYGNVFRTTNAFSQFAKNTVSACMLIKT